MAKTPTSYSLAVDATRRRTEALGSIVRFDPEHQTSQAILQVVEDHKTAALDGKPAHGYAAEAWMLALMVIGRNQLEGQDERAAARAFELAESASEAANHGWIGAARDVMRRISDMAFPEEERDAARRMLNRAGSAVRAAQKAYTSYDPEWPEARLKEVVKALGNGEGAFRSGRPDLARQLAEEVLAEAGHLKGSEDESGESLLPADSGDVDDD